MKTARFGLAVIAWMFLIAAGGAYAQAWPSKPLRLIAPFPPGGAVDQMSRAIAMKLQALGQPVIVENKPGANGIIGVDACAKGDSEGYTLCLTNNDSVTFNAYLFKKLPYAPATDLVPIVNVGFIDAVVIAHAGAPVSTMVEALNMLKVRPTR